MKVFIQNITPIKGKQMYPYGSEMLFDQLNIQDEAYT